MPMPRLLLATLVAVLPAAGAAAQAQTLSTLFTSNNGGSSGWVVMFDATVSNLNPLGLRITGVDVNCSATAATPVTVNVYITPTTYVGVERNAAAWTLVGSGDAISAARNSPTFVDIGDFELPPGTWGLAVQTVGSGQAYTNGTGSNQSYSDQNLSLQLGAALASQFLSSGTLFSPRVWNGSIYYAAVGDDVMGVFGQGCAGTNGVPTLTPSSLPAIGQTLTLDIANGPTTAGFAFFAMGFSKTTAFGTVPLPFDLTPLGFTGCSLLIDPAVQTGLGIVNGAGTFNLALPNNPAFVWTPLYAQALLFDQGANPANFSATNGCEGVVGT